MSTTPPDLFCPECGATYAAGPAEPYRCDCGHPLELDADPVATPSGDAGPVPYSRLDTRRGPWAFEEFLAVAPQVTLGEGFTPLVSALDWDAEFKLEYVSPTGSFKDRGAATVVSRAVSVGADRVLEDSSGNAGHAVATYAARAGLEADVYVPAEVSESKLMAIQRTGARPVRVEGSREAATEACIDAVAAGDGWYASHAWHPAFLSGTKTFALEVVAQRGWEAPDAVVMPVGHGTLFLGAYRGFEALHAAGLADGVPSMYAVQATGYAPLVEAFDGADPAGRPTDEAEDRADLTTSSNVQVEDSNEVADAIHIREPARMTELVEAVWATGGDVVELGEDPVELHLDALHRAGFYVEPTCAAGPAALETLRSEGTIAEDDDVVVPLTGTGLKTH